MSLSSISNQINHALGAVTWSAEEIADFQQHTGAASVKKSLRPAGDPTRPLPVILGVGTRTAYFQSAVCFFQRAEALSGRGLLVDLLTPEIIQQTLDAFYQAQAPGSLAKLVAAIGKVYAGCCKLGWARQPNPITPQLREYIKGIADGPGVRSPRFGYQFTDAERIVAYLTERSSRFALPAELALRCGLREDEIAGLRGQDIDLARSCLHVTGKGGKVRTVPMPTDIAARLNPSMQYQFTPSSAWRSAFRQTVARAAKALGIQLTGVHRLRANFAQQRYLRLRQDGLDDQAARLEISHLLGHNRLDVTYHYIPDGFSEEDAAKE